jgi:hypothetical protein
MSIHRPFGRVHRHDRRVADGPAGQLAQRDRIVVRRGLPDVQLRHKRLCVRDDHPGLEAECLGGWAGGGDRAARACRAGGHEWLVRRRLTEPPPDAIGRPMRQVERDDPSHHRPSGARYGVRHRRHGRKSTCQQGCLSPGAGRVSEGAVAMSHRTEAAVGSRVRSFSATVHQPLRMRAERQRLQRRDANVGDPLRSSRAKRPGRSPYSAGSSRGHELQEAEKVGDGLEPPSARSDAASPGCVRSSTH